MTASVARCLQANEPTTGTAAIDDETLEHLQRRLPPINTASAHPILGLPSKIPAKLLASPISISLSTNTGMSHDSVNGAMSYNDNSETIQSLSGVTFTPFSGVTDAPEPTHRLFQSTTQQQRLAPSASFQSFQSHPHMHPSPLYYNMGQREPDTGRQRRHRRASTPNTARTPKLRMQQVQQQQQGTPRLGSLGPDDDAAVIINRRGRTVTTELCPDVLSPKAYQWASDTANWSSGEYLQQAQGQQYLPTASPSAAYHLHDDATAAWTLPQQQQQVDPGMRCSGCGIAPQQPCCPPASSPTQHLTRLMHQSSTGSEAAAAVPQTSSAAGPEEMGSFSSGCRAVAGAAAAGPAGQQQQGVALDQWELFMCGLLELRSDAGAVEEAGAGAGGADDALGLMRDFSGDWLNELLQTCLTCEMLGA
jgi:hypothetical protein